MSGASSRKPSGSENYRQYYQHTAFREQRQASHTSITSEEHSSSIPPKPAIPRRRFLEYLRQREEQSGEPLIPHQHEYYDPDNVSSTSTGSRQRLDTSGYDHVWESSSQPLAHNLWMSDTSSRHRVSPHRHALGTSHASHQPRYGRRLPNYAWYQRDNARYLLYLILAIVLFAGIFVVSLEYKPKSAMLYMTVHNGSTVLVVDAHSGRVLRSRAFDFDLADRERHFKLRGMAAVKGEIWVANAHSEYSWIRSFACCKKTDKWLKVQENCRVNVTTVDSHSPLVSTWLSPFPYVRNWLVPGLSSAISLTASISSNSAIFGIDTETQTQTERKSLKSKIIQSRNASNDSTRFVGTQKNANGSDSERMDFSYAGTLTPIYHGGNGGGPNTVWKINGHSHLCSNPNFQISLPFLDRSRLQSDEKLCRNAPHVKYTGLPMRGKTAVTKGSVNSPYAMVYDSATDFMFVTVQTMHSVLLFNASSGKPVKMEMVRKQIAEASKNSSSTKQVIGDTGVRRLLPNGFQITSAVDLEQTDNSTVNSVRGVCIEPSLRLLFVAVEFTHKVMAFELGSGHFYNVYNVSMADGNLYRKSEPLEVLCGSPLYNNTLFVGDKKYDLLHAFSVTETEAYPLWTSAPSPNLKYPTGLAVSDEALYVVSKMRNRIEMYEPNTGNLIGTLVHFGAQSKNKRKYYAKEDTAESSQWKGEQLLYLDKNGCSR